MSVVLVLLEQLSALPPTGTHITHTRSLAGLQCHETHCTARLALRLCGSPGAYQQCHLAVSCALLCSAASDVND